MILNKNKKKNKKSYKNLRKLDKKKKETRKITLAYINLNFKQSNISFIQTFSKPSDNLVNLAEKIDKEEKYKKDAIEAIKSYMKNEGYSDQEIKCVTDMWDKLDIEDRILLTRILIASFTAKESGNLNLENNIKKKSNDEKIVDFHHNNVPLGFSSEKFDGYDGSYQIAHSFVTYDDDFNETASLVICI